MKREMRHLEERVEGLEEEQERMRGKIEKLEEKLKRWEREQENSDKMKGGVGRKG